MRRRNLGMGITHAQQSGKVHRIVDPTERSGSPVVRAIFSELNCLGYVEGKTLLIERYCRERACRIIWTWPTR